MIPLKFAAWQMTLAPMLLLCMAAGIRQTESPLTGTRTFKLDNGLMVITREQRDAPLVAIDLWIRAGSASDPADGNGTAHFIEHLVFKGTPTRAPGEIDAAFEDIGSTLNAGTTRDATHFFATVASPYLSQSLQVLADGVSSSAIPAEEVERERAVILDESARTRNDWKRTAINAAYASVYGNANFARPVLGTAESLAGLKRDAIAEFHRRWYVPNNAVLVLVGAISPESAREAANAAFADWKTATIPAESPRPESVALQNGITRESSLSDAVVSIAVPLPAKVTESERRAGEILAALLGDERHGRILESIRKVVKGPAASAELAASRGPGVFAVMAKGAGKSHDLLLKTLQAELDRILKEGITEGEAEWARRRLLGAYLFEAETFSGQARLLGQHEMLGSYQTAVTYMDSVRGVSAAQVNEFAQKYFVARRRSTSVLSPK